MSASPTEGASIGDRSGPSKSDHVRTAVFGDDDAHALTPLGADAACGLRERKKRLTRRALHEAALTLVSERGLDEVTTDEIAAAADVSARTFFNYFATKDAAVIGMAPDIGDRLGAALAARPASEDLFTALTAVVSAAVSVLESDPLRAPRRTVVARDPRLGAAMVGATREVESSLVEAASTRHDGGDDLRVRVTVAAVMAAARASALVHGHRHAEHGADSPHGQGPPTTSSAPPPDLGTTLADAMHLLATGLAPDTP